MSLSPPPKFGPHQIQPITVAEWAQFWRWLVNLYQQSLAWTSFPQLPGAQATQNPGADAARALAAAIAFERPQLPGSRVEPLPVLATPPSARADETVFRSLDRPPPQMRPDELNDLVAMVLGRQAILPNPGNFQVPPTPPGPWTTFVPTWAVSGVGTITPSSVNAHYQQIGKTVYVRILAMIMLSVAANTFSVSVPVLQADGTDQMVPCAVHDNTMGFAISAFTFFSGASTLTIEGTAPTPFPTTAFSVRIGGVYEAA